MAKIVGKLPPAPRPNLFGALLNRVNELARLKSEFHGREGLRRLAGPLAQLPDHVTVILQPTLGFMQIDCCVIGPGRIMAINTLHWQGRVLVSKQEAWVGHPISLHLGRPDRRSAVFLDKLGFTGLTKGFELDPVVICTAGKAEVDLQGAQARVVPWDEAPAFLARSFPTGVQGLHNPAEIVKLLTGQ